MRQKVKTQELRWGTCRQPRCGRVPGADLEQVYEVTTDSLAGKPLQDTIMAGFRAQTSGVFYLNSSWSFNGFATLFWTSTPWNAVKAISHGMNVYDFSVSLYPSSRANAFPVRCLRD